MLSFVLPKDESEEQASPDAACFLRSDVLIGICQKGLPVPLAKARPPCHTPPFAY